MKGAGSMIRPLFVVLHGNVRHCEPTGRANARPMTGSAKQSISMRNEKWIASSQVLLAMTPLRYAAAGFFAGTITFFTPPYAAACFFGGKRP
jgi:hypothetical protein